MGDAIRAFGELSQQSQTELAAIIIFVSMMGMLAVYSIAEAIGKRK